MLADCSVNCLAAAAVTAVVTSSPLADVKSPHPAVVHQPVVVKLSILAVTADATVAAKSAKVDCLRNSLAARSKAAAMPAILAVHLSQHVVAKSLLLAVHQNQPVAVKLLILAVTADATAVADSAKADS